MVNIRSCCILPAIAGFLFACGPGSTQCRAGGPERESDSLPAPVEQKGVAVIEVAPSLKPGARERLQQKLSELGLTLAPTKTAGFPGAGAAQDLQEDVWVMQFGPASSYREVRSRLLEWRRTDADAELEAGLRGILPGFKNPETGESLFFRPSHLVVMLTPRMALDRVTDSLAVLSGLTQSEDSLTTPAFTRYLWRRVSVDVDPDADLMAALDTLRSRPWVRAASPVLVDGGNRLPVFPRVALMQELAVGELRKFRPLELVVIAQVCRIDGPDAAVEVARSAERDVDSLGRLCLRVEALDSYEHLKTELESFGAEVLSHEQGVDVVAVVTMFPCKWLAVLAGLRTVTTVLPHSAAAGSN